MKIEKNKLSQIIFLLLSLLMVVELKAQVVENNLLSRASAEFSFKPIKNFKINLTPELRFDNDFALDKFLFEAEVVYKPIKFISLGTSYRMGGNLRENKGTEFISRFAINATAANEFGRFEPAFKLSYTNDADDDIVNETFMRYKFSLNYNIKDCKLTPFAGAEAFQGLTDGGLYKMRYFVGADYKLFKNNYLGLNYKFDYFYNEFKNNHIISLGYKIKF